MTTVVTGGSGMLGHAFAEYNVIRVGSKDYDLRDFDQCINMIDDYKADRIIHLAAKVGGVLGNMTFAGEYFKDNLLMNINILEAARVRNVSKVISALSTCIYPDDGLYPLTEKNLHDGPPHSSNFSYAFAKRMIDVQSRAYRQQYGCNFITAIPNNLLGEHDNFENLYSHVAPAIIRKVFDAKINNKSEILLWGDGTSLREFTYSKDAAKIFMLLLENYNDPEPINIGNTLEISIKNLAELIIKEMKFDGALIWDKTMPSGQYRKPSDNSKFISLFNEFTYTPIEIAIKNTCEWFVASYPNIRGV